MPRCLRLHKVPTTINFCAVCGARVVPGWVWAGLGALLLALCYGAATRLPTTAQPSPTSAPLPTATAAPTRTFIPTPTRTARPAASPTLKFTPTPTATLYPRAALVSFHHRYVTAQGEANGWILRQETTSDDPCAWFTLSPQTDGRVALLTCYNRYITAPWTGTIREDWLLRQESVLGVCGLFTIHDLGNGEVTFETCAETYFTAGDGGWDPGLQWSVVAETQVLLDWEKFRLEAP